MTTSEEKVYHALLGLRGPVDANEVAAKTDLSPTTVRAALKRLARRGLVKRRERVKRVRRVDRFGRSGTLTRQILYYTEKKPARPHAPKDMSISALRNPRRRAEALDHYRRGYRYCVSPPSRRLIYTKTLAQAKKVAGGKRWIPGTKLYKLVR